MQSASFIYVLNTERKIDQWELSFATAECFGWARKVDLLILLGMIVLDGGKVC